MERASRELLDELLLTPSPTGAEQAVQRKVRDRFKDIAHVVEPDVHGNLILGLNTRAKKKVMLSGHADQIGYLVKHVSPQGYVYLDKLGGVDSGVVLGEHMIVHTRLGPVEGVIGRKPVHLQTGAEVQQIPVGNKIWLDIGAKDKAEAERAVCVGDYVTFRMQVTDLRNELICSPGLDNKAGLFVCLEAMRQCARSRCDVALYVVSSVQEEIGSRGAATATSRLSPDVGIAVDVVPATDDPSNDVPPQDVIPVRLRGGPTISTGPNTNPVVGHMLVEAAKRLDLPYQPDPSGKTAPNDARVIQTADSGVAAASVGIPQRNMHTQVEVCALSDLEHTVRLLVDFIQSVRDDTDFRPINFNG